MGAGATAGFDPDHSTHPHAILGSGDQPGGFAMTSQGAIYLAAILVMFVGFAAVLGWTDYTTTRAADRPLGQ